MTAKNISEQLLEYMQAQKEKSGTDKNTLKYHQDHWSELGFGTQLESELAYHEMVENPQAEPVRRDSASKPLSPIAAQKAARSKQPVGGANAANTVRKPKK